jgi:hypothetical protein
MWKAFERKRRRETLWKNARAAVGEDLFPDASAAITDAVAEQLAREGLGTE